MEVSGDGDAVVQVGVIGEVTAGVDGRVVNLGPARQRCVFAALVVEANRMVPLMRLADRVWGEQVPHRAAGTLRTYLSRLRAALPAGESFGIHRRPGGYVLTVDEDAVDLHHFRKLVAAAKATGDDDRAAKLYGEALALWRGEPFAGIESPWVAGVREALGAEYLTARLDFHDVQLRRGRHAELAADMLSLVAAHPWHERLAAQAMLALYRGGRQAEALAFYDEMRVRLSEELGVDPGAPLQELHQRVLAADPALEIGPTGAARQLPAVPRTFTGRTRELSELDRTNRVAGVSVVAGVGGVGKTWLALRWAHDNADRFPDGQLYVNLRGFDARDEPLAPESALRALLAGLGVPPAAVPATVDELAALFRSVVANKRVLVVLDNARDSAQVTPLLPGGADRAVVVTSRNRLPGLMSVAGALPVPMDVLSDVDAREVLLAHLGAARLAADPAAVTELLTFCAGLPLALGIVAARAITYPDFPLPVFADELRSAATRLDVLHQDEAASLRYVLSWSFQALSPAAARLFAQLGVMPGPSFGLAAAASVAGIPMSAVGPPLRELTAAHLVTEYEPARYRMHDLVRLYATELAEQSHGTDPLRRLLDHYLRTAYGGALALKPHRQRLPIPDFDDAAVLVELHTPADAMVWFTRECPSLVAAVHRAAQTGFRTHTWQLTWTMADFFERYGQWRDYIATNGVALVAAVDLGDRIAQARVHRTLARAHLMTQDFVKARDHFDEAEALFTAIGDLVGVAQLRIGIGQVYVRQGAYETALTFVRRALATFREIGHRPGEATALNAAGWCEAQLGRLESAETHCRASLALHQEVADRHGRAGAWDSLGYVLAAAGRPADAVPCFQQSVQLARELRDRASEGEALTHLGEAHESLGDPTQARTTWTRAVEVLEELDPSAATDLRDRLTGLAHSATS